MISLDYGGAGITAYHLWVSARTFKSDFIKVSSYDGTADTYSIQGGEIIDTHTVTVGGCYAIKHIAENNMVLSADS